MFGTASTWLGEFHRQINNSTPILVQFVPIAPSDPPTGLDFGSDGDFGCAAIGSILGCCCGITAASMTNSRMNVRVQKGGNVERKKDDIGPNGYLPGRFVFAYYSHTPFRFEQDGNNTINEGRISHDQSGKHAQESLVLFLTNRAEAGTAGIS
jgi:hypothetical protein